MMYLTEYYYAPRYEFTSRNQHGSRYKKISSKRINVVKLSCKSDNVVALIDLIALGHTLDVPVHYDFKGGTAYIKIMSGQAVMQL